MPISREEFQAGEINLALAIRALLQENASLAVTAVEVHESLSRRATLEEVGQALETLVTEGLVLTKEIASQRWYTIILPDRPIGFRRR